MIPADARPRLYPWFRVVRDRDAYLFEYGGQLVRIAGPQAVPLLTALLPLIDGRLTVEEIQRRLGEWDGEAVVRVLSALKGNGIVAVAGSSPLSGEDGDLLTAIMGGRENDAPVDRARVGVLGTGSLAQAVTRLISASGVVAARAVTVDDPPTTLDLVVVAVQGEDLSRLDSWNRRMLECRQSWLLVLPFDGAYGTVGPLFIPGETACYACFQTRRRSVLEDPDIARLYDDLPAYHPMGAGVTSLLAGLAVHLALRWILRRDAWIGGMLYAVGLMPHPTVSAHEVWPVPRCPVCRPLSQHTPAPWFPEQAEPAQSPT
ncbi:MAG: TOMM precursor leader peptide-binding protein [Armatimonadota bacterium]|nr:TOMM precursor leader peptide-binding protein [Armatimonadota bacterium]MDR7451299.1 TOMM precursor leader peptide-binding protein [Armatimonadota bacterium]MDR7466798.1 TOMM precursor leader peptide-binding protein [Armatimonadota bacterium]MDR7492729.1 TOMM precursor leader peptide-binding protein [Armatimonadota bacterium]MDR7498505.1 TOMM precursor leader peptide-binding protein [Armatimonadota bacterium]